MYLSHHAPAGAIHGVRPYRPVRRTTSSRPWQALWAAAGLLLLTLALRPAWAAAPDPADLSLRSAITAALERSQALAAPAANARAARELAVAAGQRPDPVLRLSLNNVPVNGADRWSTTNDFMTMQSVGIMQTLPSQAKRQARSQKFEREADASLEQRQMLATEIQRETAVAWFELRAVELKVSLLKAQIDEAGRQVLATQTAFRSGRGSQTDGIAAREALSRLEQALLQMQADQASAHGTLARWTGLASGIALNDPLPIANSSLDAQPFSSTLDQHIALRAMQARVEAARANAEVMRLEREPDWSVELMLSKRGPQYSDMMSVGLSVPLTWDRPQRQDRELAASLAQADALEAEFNEARRERLLDMERQHQNWRAALAQLQLIDRDRLPLAQQRVEAVLAAYRSGTTPLTAVLEARQAALMLAIERIDIELQAARLWAALEFLIPNSSPVRE
jgi:outer membrane protein TolC